MRRALANSFLAILCFLGGQFTAFSGKVICVAKDGCVELVGHAHGSHDCEDEKEHSHNHCCDHHEEKEESCEDDGNGFAFEHSDCTDILIHGYNMLSQSKLVRVVMPTPVIAPQPFSFQDERVIYKAPDWKRELVYPPPILSHIKSTVILC